MEVMFTIHKINGQNRHIFFGQYYAKSATVKSELNFLKQSHKHYLITYHENENMYHFQFHYTYPRAECLTNSIY